MKNIKNIIKAGLMFVVLSMPANSLVAETSFTETIKNTAYNISSGAKVIGSFAWENKASIAFCAFTVIALALVSGFGYKYMSNQQALLESQIKALKNNLNDVKKDLTDSTENLDGKKIKETLKKIEKETENIRLTEATTTNTIKTVTDKALEIKNQVETTINKTSKTIGDKARELFKNIFKK